MTTIDGYVQELDSVAEPENKLTLLVTLELVIGCEKRFFRDGKMSVKFLKEKLRHEFVTFMMPLYSPFAEEFGNNILRLIEAGICPEKMGELKPSFLNRPQNTDKEVPALKMDDLGIGFLVCMVPLALSIIAFICELAVPKMKILAIKLRDLLTILCLMRAVADIRL